MLRKGKIDYNARAVLHSSPFCIASIFHCQVQDRVLLSGQGSQQALAAQMDVKSKGCTSALAALQSTFLKSE